MLNIGAENMGAYYGIPYIFWVRLKLSLPLFLPHDLKWPPQLLSYLHPRDLKGELSRPPISF
jgi:hypothetical protein